PYGCLGKLSSRRITYMFIVVRFGIRVAYPKLNMLNKTFAIRLSTLSRFSSDHRCQGCSRADLRPARHCWQGWHGLQAANSVM
ncbi:MAG: hypothetical protein WB628_11715, partial [Candidatus Sulfotelmatobacter sp.]